MGRLPTASRRDRVGAHAVTSRVGDWIARTRLALDLRRAATKSRRGAPRVARPAACRWVRVHEVRLPRGWHLLRGPASGGGGPARRQARLWCDCQGGKPPGDVNWCTPARGAHAARTGLRRRLTGSAVHPITWTRARIRRIPGWHLHSARTGAPHERIGVERGAASSVRFLKRPVGFPLVTPERRGAGASAAWVGSHRPTALFVGALFIGARLRPSLRGLRLLCRDRM